MRCLSCSTENVATRRFCAGCGRRVPWPCPACGFDNEPTAKFCGGCDKPLSEAISPEAVSGAPRPVGAERRQLTVMFCDLVGSTALASRVDPEDLREVIGAYHKCVAETIERPHQHVALLLLCGEDAGPLVLAKAREYRLGAHEDRRLYELVAEHEAIDVEVMAVNLPAPRLLRRWRAEDAEPIEPLAVFLRLAGDFEGMLVEAHDVAGGLVPARAHRFAH